MRPSLRTLSQMPSPISAAEALLGRYDGCLPVIDASQGVPSYPTAPEIVEHLARTVRSPEGGKYTARAGLPELRQLVACEISEEYDADITPEQVLITAGCNQAFCIAISAIADRGDDILLPSPYYFNHRMWLGLQEIGATILPTAPQFIPDPKAAAALLGPQSRAIILVTPGNPTGAAIPPATISEFADLAASTKTALVIDETYRLFRNVDEPPHQLLSRPDWGDSIISLHSFSKEFAIPGYRVGAVVAHPDLIVEMMKLAHCMTICAPRIGQEAVIEGLRSAKPWRKARAAEILARQSRFEAVLAAKPGGFDLQSCGAFFGWVRHPFAGVASAKVVEQLMDEHAILALPGDLFTPTDEGFLRFSFANLSFDEIDELAERLGRASGLSMQAAR